MAAALLFFVFGFRMIQEGLAMEAGEKGREKMQEEIREVQKEVEEAEEAELGPSSGDSYSLRDLEEGGSSHLQTQEERDSQMDSLTLPVNLDSAESSTTNTPGLRRPRTPVRSRKSSISLPSRQEATTSIKEGIKNLCHLFFSPIFIQSFILTFLAEWGDRSQITTIALAAAHVRAQPSMLTNPCILIASPALSAECLACDVGYHAGSLVLYLVGRVRRSMDFAAYFHQAQ